MSSSIFVKEGVEKVDLGGGFWIEIPCEVGYGQIESATAELGNETNQQLLGKKLVIKLAKGWNLTEDDGTPAELNEKNFDRLPVDAARKIVENVTKKISLDKKK